SSVRPPNRTIAADDHGSSSSAVIARDDARPGVLTVELDAAQDALDVGDIAAVQRAADSVISRGVASVMRADDDWDPGDAVPENGRKGAPAGSQAAPIFDHSGGKTVTINADSAPEFAQNITAVIGSPHTSPTFTPDVQFDTKTTAAGADVPGSRRITSIGL